MVKDDVPQLSPNLKIDSAALDRILKIISEMIKNKFRLVGTSRDARGGDRFRTMTLDENAQSRLWALQQSTSVLDEERYGLFESSFTDITSFRLDPAQARLLVKKENKRFPLGLEGGGIQGVTNLLFTTLVETDQLDHHGHRGTGEPRTSQAAAEALQGDSEDRPRQTNLHRNPLSHIRRRCPGRDDVAGQTMTTGRRG